MFVGMNYIDGDFVKHSPDFSSYNPATEEELGVFPETPASQVYEAVGAAKKAFKFWRELSRINRAEYFDKLAEIMKARKEEVARAISLETGKTLNESMAEVIEAIHMVQFTFGMGRMPVGSVMPSEIAEKDAYVIRKPKGIVAVITPWNFPFAILHWNAGPAILEGNTVVFKPSEETPMVGQIIADMFDKADFPPGVFNLIHGGKPIGKLLVEHKDINHISFTGSVLAGTYIKKECADTHNKTCSCEMGSKSAVIVFDDADIDQAVEACVISAFKLSGQRCVSSGRLLIQDSIIETFQDKFIKKVSRLKTGDSLTESDIYYGPIINKRQLERIEEYNKLANNSIVDVLLFGDRVDRKGYFLTPHVYSQFYTEDSNQPFLKDEVFGPHVALIPFVDVDHAIELYNSTDYGLSCAVCTNDYKIMRQIRDKCDFGMGYVNLPSVGAESHLPFGGLKKSGYGGSSAAGAFDAVVNKITWTVNHADGGIKMAQGLK